MKPSEVAALLQAKEPELIQISRGTRALQQRAYIVYKDIMDILRNTHFASKQEHDYAYAEARGFIERLFKPFNGES